eukprot:3411208-Pleurochrysis_carterae.AAC.1
MGTRRGAAQPDGPRRGGDGSMISARPGQHGIVGTGAGQGEHVTGTPTRRACARVKRARSARDERAQQWLADSTACRVTGTRTTGRAPAGSPPVKDSGRVPPGRTR